MTSYFRDLLEKEKKELSDLCQHWEQVSECESGLTEEAEGNIRTAVGQATLLMNKRLKQFASLISSCENQTGEKKTTCEDLQGFWDMVHFQIEDVHKRFQQLAELQENGWVPQEGRHPAKQTIALPKKGKKPTVSCEAEKARRAAIRQWIADAKARKAGGEPSAEKENVRVFEVPGFFTVSSPVRTKHGKDVAQKTPGSVQRTPLLRRNSDPWFE